MKTKAVSNQDILNVSRRGFLKSGAVAAGGLALGFHWGAEDATAQGAGAELNAFISIAPDGAVTLQIHKSEMGQGVVTSIPQILSDELEADWSRIRTEFAPVAPVYGTPMMGTYGSLSIRTGWNPLRKTAAAAREMLVQAAANQWGIAPSACVAKNGFVTNPATKQQLGYGQLAVAASELDVPANPTLKTPAEFRYIGTSPQRLDTPSKTNGTAPFGIDMRHEGMLYAAIQRCPVPGGKAASFDDTAARKIQGVEDVFEIDDGVAVVATNTWAAFQGRNAVNVKWNLGPHAGNSTEGLRTMFAEMCTQPGNVRRNEGDAPAVIAAADKKKEAVYEAPYLSHAPMEPLNALVLVTDSSCDIWVGTQIQTVAQQAAAAITGLSNDQIKIHTQYLGGGFGRRGGEDYVHEAVQVANHLKGTPVKLTWSREDDLQHDTYRPMSYTTFAAALDANGYPEALHAHVACPPFGGPTTSVEGIADMKYAIPNVRVEHHAPDVGIPVSYWRSVGYSQNTPFMECFLDELAAEAGIDPVEYRRHLLADQPRLLNVLNLAAERAGWGTPLPAGHFRGVAVGNNIGSFNAQVAEVSIDNGKLNIHKVWCAIDCGHVVNPKIIKQQIEGGIVYGLSAALKQEITFENGRVVQTNFHNYDPLRIDETPDVDVVIVESTERPGGIGEASTPTAPPAVFNAIFAATGKQVRVMPLKNQLA